jgi:hypothetical protein
MTRHVLVIMCAVAATGLLLTGCPSTVPDEVVTDGEVQAVLRSLEDQGGFETADFDGMTPEDEAPAFGGDPSAYEGVPLEAGAQDNTPAPEAPEGALTGFLAAHLHAYAEGGSTFDGPGAILGHWGNGDQQVLGHLHGEYKPLPMPGEGTRQGDVPDDMPAEVDPNLVAHGVFRAKVVTEQGRFVGMLRGRYGKVSDGRSFFAAKWLGAHGEGVGAVRGSWTDNEGGNGRMVGRWVRVPVQRLPQELLDYPFDDGDFGGLTTADEDAFFGEDPALYGDLPQAALDEDEALPEPQRCARGRLFGKFSGETGGTSDVEPGVLRGRWIQVPPVNGGLLKGVYEPLANAAGGVFYAKVISDGVDPAETAGQFKGFVRGRYGAVEGVSVFVGEWFNASLEPMGDMPEEGFGVFKGAWGERCAPAPPEEPPSTE